MILGIDEVGRGPWAGPLVIGAVVLGGVEIEGLTDSKKLSKKRRVELDLAIREQAAGFGLGWVHAHEIDEIGLSEALRLATRRAVEQITAPYHEIIIDGTINFLSDTTKAIGDKAETEATNYLVREGHSVIERNWKTKYCEIDIVSSKDDTIYFTEVKYRKTPHQGGGIAAITGKKLEQMKFAAKLYAQIQSIQDSDLRLNVLTLTGAPPVIETYLELE